MRGIARKPLFWIFLASLLPVVSLFHPGMPFVHDGQDHVARIANFYAALREGIIVPRWAGSLNWGYGHPILMFLYPLPEYVASAFHFIGFSLVDSTKLVFGFSFIASAVTMFLWLNAAYGTEAGIIGTLLYTFAPYRFVDLHVRGALGEHVAFIFPPLGMYLLWRLSRTKHIYGLYPLSVATALSIAGLILSHNAVAIMFLPIIGIYGVYLWVAEVTDRWSFAISSILAVTLGFGLSAFFWLPALMEGKFTLRDVVTAGEALRRFVPWPWFIYSPWNYGGTEELTKALGIPQWIGVACAFMMLVKMKQKKLNVFIAGLLILFLASLFIQTTWSAPIWRASKLLQDFQFPWRFLSVSVFVAAVLGGLAFARTKKLFLICYSLFIIFITVPMWHPIGFQIHDDSFYSGVYAGTTDTGESSPVWSVRFMEHTPAHPMDVIDGDATIIVGKRTSILHEYTLTVRVPTLMMENTLYFPGWMVYVNDQPTRIEWQNPTYRGLMTFHVAPGTVRVKVVFGSTKIRRYANMISATTLALLALAGVGVFVWQNRKHYR